MLQIGVQTKGILPERDIDQAFELIADAGFNSVDINVDAFLLNSDVYAGKINPFFDSSVDDLVLYFMQYRNAMDRNGIHPSQMHAPYPVYVEGRVKQNEYMQGNVIPKSIIIAEALGVPWVVIHPFKVQYIHGKEYEKQLNVEYFKMLVPLLKQCGVKVCFENLYEGMGQRLVEGVCADPNDANWYIDTLNAFAGEELFGLCLDTGHLQLIHRDPYSYIKTVGKRLKAVHIHENDGEGDLHQLPYSFGNKKDAGMDWDGFYRALKEIDFQGTLSFETYPCMNSFPYSMSKNVLKTIHSIGAYMAAEIDGMDAAQVLGEKRIESENQRMMEGLQDVPGDKEQENQGVMDEGSSDCLIRLGIIGTGRIAGRMMEEIKNGNFPIQVECVYNPHEESALRFSRTHQIENCATDLEELASMVDAVYIAAPHETHYSYAKKMLSKGVHVLCEKPLAMAAEEAKDLYAIAKENNCVLMEALKTAYCPGFQKLMEVAKSGMVGEIKDVEAAFTRLTPINTREYMNLDYNGSMLEFGSYVCLPAVKLLGSRLKEVHFQSVRAVNGVDTYTKAYMEFDRGMATGKTGLGVKSEGQLLVSGTKGYILAKSPWWMTQEFEVRFENPNEKKIYRFPYEGSGLQYELEVFCEEIGNMTDVREVEIDDEVLAEETCKPWGANDENCGVTENESVAIAQVMEAFRQWNEPRFREKQDEFLRMSEKRLSDKPAIWAHRGLCYQYPENTLEAFQAAAELDGLTGIELDVQFTKDQEIVVIHDETLNRTAGINGSVCNYLLKEIKQMAIPFGDGTSTTIPTLREVLELLAPYCKEKGLLINIELKTSVVRYPGIEEATMKLVSEYGLEDYIVYSSFLTDSIAQVKRIDSTARTGALATYIGDCIQMAREAHADALHPMTLGLNEELPEDMRNMPVRAWNGGEPFFQDGRPFTEKDLTVYQAFGATELFTNVADVYLNGTDQ